MTDDNITPLNMSIRVDDARRRQTPAELKQVDLNEITTFLSEAFDLLEDAQTCAHGSKEHAVQEEIIAALGHLARADQRLRCAHLDCASALADEQPLPTDPESAA